ncbi:hypothetical protein ACFSCZ_03410 [Siminovitchia sediminis]|uniref:Uncharacterized protein n=1 Tax=Siminovitchia sediminis TaxID=1274353 RepID=A0ABW4KE41_9BACI
MLTYEDVERIIPDHKGDRKDENKTVVFLQKQGAAGMLRKYIKKERQNIRKFGGDQI